MQELLIVAGAHLLAVASPGPDLAVVLKNSISQGRTNGIYTALGIASGITVHILYSVIGLAVLISRSIVLFNVIKFLGAAYLIWIGLKALRSKKSPLPVAESNEATNPSANSSIKAFRQGFLTNVTNPKATLFFLSLFTQVISPETSNFMKILYGIEMTVVTFIWFTLVATFMTQKPIRTAFANIKHHIDHVFGVALIALGLKVATSK